MAPRDLELVDLDVEAAGLRGRFVRRDQRAQYSPVPSGPGRTPGSVRERFCYTRAGSALVPLVSRDIPDTALRLVASFFDAGTVRRAVDYARTGRVHLVKPPPWPVVAQVRGTEGYVVTVHYAAATSHLRGECSCPAGGDCKHAAATALVAFAREAEHAVHRLESARQVAVGNWLADFGREERRAGADTADRVVAYVIDARDGSMGITALQCARLKRGGLGNGSVIAALGDPGRGPPAWVEVDDLRRIAMLRAVTRAAPHSVRLPLARVHGELLRDLAAGGYLFWESTRGAPLAYGPPVTDALRWQPSPGDPDACRLGLDSHIVIVPAHECHYIDPVASLIGQLDLGMPAELVQRLMTGPPVPAAMRETVERSLRPLMTPAAGPLWSASTGPEQDAGEALLPDEDPAGSLRPRMHASVAGDESTGPAVHITGEAQYGDERFALAEWDPDRPRPRDLVAEGRLHARLQSLIGGLPNRGGPASSLALLADARHVAHVIVPILLGEGWDCELAPDFPHEAPMVGLEWVERLHPVAGSRGWFSVELGVCVAGRTIPLLPVLLQAIRDGQLIVGPDGSAAPVGAGINLRLPDGELVHVPADRVQRWLRPLVELELAGLDRAGELVVPAPVAAEIAGDAPGRFAAPDELAAAGQRLAALLALEPRHEGTDFAGSLRPYQRIGLAWLRTMHDAGYGGLLADEMGLGKTVQVLAFLDGLRADGQLGDAAPALVVAPRSVVGTWAREASRFTPGLRPIVHLGADRADRAASLTCAPLLITSYQTLVRDIELLREVGWTTVVFDEAQALKNASTQLRSAAATLRAGSRICVTGTPIENHLGELWSQIDLAMPGLLGRRSSFEAMFRRPIEKYGEVAPLEYLRRRIRPFLLRRTKEGVELDLPPKTEIVERIDLDTAQRDLYESLRVSLDERVGEALARQGIQGSSMVILDALLKLRQCCCDPRLVKLPEARRVEGSAKLERLMAMLEELADSGRSTLVFSQFTSMLRLIEKACAQAGISTVVLTGATRDRDEVIHRFQAGDAAVFLISLKAGGVGLNLTRADTVIHYDPWWNPAAEAQATDRAHRIGQDRHVMVYKLVAQGTLEEAICTLQDEKRQLTAAALRGGGVTSLAAGDLEALYRRIV